jgi:alkylhydroperoxidase family enzyme
VGISDEKIGHLGDDPLPDGVFDPAEAVIVRYAQLSTRMQPIGDELYGELTRHFDVQQIIELCMTVSLSNQVNRFHATFLTDLDEDMADALSASCPLPLPPHPTSGD